MLTTIMQAVCAGLFAVGLLVMVVEIRARLDRSLLYAGICLMLLCTFAGIDLLTGWKGVFWLNLQQVIFCFIPPTMLHYILLISGKQPGRGLQIFYLTSILFALLFVSGLGVHATTPHLTLSFVYRMVYTPFVLVSVAIVVIAAGQGANSGIPRVERDLRLHLVALGYLSLLESSIFWEPFAVSHFSRASTVSQS